MIYSKDWHRSVDLLGAALLALQWQVKVDVQCPEIRLLVKYLILNLVVLWNHRSLKDVHQMLKLDLKKKT